MIVDSMRMDQDDDILRHLCRPVSFLIPERLVHPPSWLGHVPFAFWIMEAARPATLVELGAHTGNSYSAFCQAARTLGHAVACHAVDTWEGDPQAGYYGDEVFNELSAHHDPRYGGFSRLMRMTFDEAAGRFADGSIDLLHIDGLHTYDAVRHDFETWLPKMSPRGVVLFHDVNVRKGDFGVWRLWEEVSATRPHFTFLHSNGLGVLGVGESLSDDMRWLFSIQEEADRGGASAGLKQVRDFFQRQGDMAIQAETIDSVSRTRRHLETEVAQVRGVLDEVIAHNDALKGVVAGKDRDIGELQKALEIKDGNITVQAEALETLRAGLKAMEESRDAVLAERHEAVRARDRDIAILQEGVAELNLRVGDLRGDVAGLTEAVNERDARLAAAQDIIDAHSRNIAAHQEALAHYQGVVAERDRQIASLYASTSWKVSKPVRAMGRIASGFRKLYRSRRHQMILEPLHDVLTTDDGYESVGGDPAFRLTSNRGHLPVSWCMISYRVAHSSVPLIPSLYMDDGSGFSELRTIRLPAGATGLVQQLALLSPRITGLRFDPTNRPARFSITDFNIRELGKLNLLLACLRRKEWHPLRVLLYLRQNGWAATKQRILQELMPLHRLNDYEAWVDLFDTLCPDDVAAIRAEVERMVTPPTISIVMPAYDSPPEYLRRAVDSVRAQLYPHWELCVADDASPKAHVAEIMRDYAARDPRIKFVRRETNGHIAAATNSALELATGQFVAFMDHDDELPPHALYMVADRIIKEPELDLIYSDEDKIDENGKRYDPYFKSEYNADLLLGQNMFNHLSVFRRELLDRLGGLRPGFEGSQDYDLSLRAVEAIPPERIGHIPFVLYHWRVFAHSDAFSTQHLDRATDAARRALREHFERRGVEAVVEPAPATERFTRVRYPLPAKPPRVSLIIPTRDRVELLRGCVDGILHRTDYPDIEVVIVDNDSEKPDTLAYFDDLRDDPRVMIVPYHGKFNYSAINNFAAGKATGELIGLVNNDIEVIGPEWLSEMVSHALRPEVGAVGAKLLYADGTVQHAGVITGICGVAGHAQKHADRRDFGYFSRLQLTQDMSCVTAACLIMRKAVFDEVEGLDEENLAVAFNDVDLCLRVREKGYRVIWTPFAELYHLESASRGPDTAPDKIHRFMREIDHMNNRWGDSLRDDPYYSPNLTLDGEDFGLAFPPRVIKPWYSKQGA